MLDTRCPNPVVILDEIDKIGLGRQNGRVWETLLTLLEPSSSRSVIDEFLLGEVNYSAISWVATANDLRVSTGYDWVDMPAPLLSRFEIVTVDTPKEEHFDIILENILRDVAKEYGNDEKVFPAFEPEIRDILQRNFAQNFYSLRYLRKAVFRVLEVRALDNRRPEDVAEDRDEGFLLQ